jgi:hypothetical protein
LVIILTSILITSEELERGMKLHFTFKNFYLLETMTTWEYKHDFVGENENLALFLRNSGVEGWELVSFHRLKNEKIVELIFKKKINSNK